MAKFCSLYSSSSGNSTYIGTSAGGILVDVGVSAKKTVDALKNIDVDPSEISGIFITHEHSDHINGVRVFASKYNIPVYATEGTLDGMSDYGVFKSRVNAYIVPESGMESSGIFIRSFKTSHDSRESCGYSLVTPDGKRIAIATDTGIVTDDMDKAVCGCDLVLLESNHDIRMLKMGPYPFSLKQRILSDRGHLNNDDSAEFAKKLVGSGTTRLVLGHLSKENNIPSLAYETAKAAITEIGAEENTDYMLTVAGDLNAPICF